ncbi:hypothetical protein KI688_007681 [Linnemannia hyalina]|uniref:Galactose oxidase n=1 Tax=Linnemannia hyalina TaxID=64524 RepID=A0A9P7XHP1_9FUNG|nr:hypothetical protein KI688_007681 [Linnemannia hyalina]
MALDLSVAWPSTAPAWTQLEPGPKQSKFPAVFSKDNLTFYAFHITATKSPPISSTFQYSVKTGKWTATPDSAISGDVAGIGAVTNPLTGAIVCAGGCTDLGRGKVHIWDPLAKTAVLQPDNTVTVLNSITNLTTLSTTGAAPPSTVNHCMAATDDGLLVIVYGGQNLNVSVVNGDLYQLNVANGLWSKSVVNGLPRANSACTIAGDQFLVYGGTDDKGQVSNSILVYDYVKVQWITQYNPPASIGQPLYPLVPPTNSTLTPTSTTSTGPSTSPPTATTSPGPGAGDDGSKGGLIGGIVAAIVVVGIIVGYILYHRRQRRREEKRQEQQVGGGDGHDAQFAAKEDFSGRGSKDEWNAQPQRGRPQANTKNDYDGDDDGAYAVATGRQKPRAPQDTQDEYKRPPQAPQDVDDTEEFEQDLHEIENQQMQLDLKRQLLVLQQRQGQRVVGRSSPPKPELNHAGSISSDGSGGGGGGGGGSGGRGRWPRPPGIVGEPQYVQQDDYVPPPPPPKAMLHHPTVQMYPERPTSSNYGYGYADSGSTHRGHNPQTFN